MSHYPHELSDLANQTVVMLPAAVPFQAFLEKLWELWRGERGVEPAYRAGLITAEEAAQGVAARIETWIVDGQMGALQHGQWNADAFVAACVAALESGAV